MIELQWLGVAGFRVAAGATAFLIDPYVARVEDATPKQTIRPANLCSVGPIFLSHGHFDHAADVGEIAGEGQVVCGAPTALGSALRGGVPLAQLRPARPGQFFEFEGFSAQPFESRHVRFDLPLIFAACKRLDWRALTAANLALRYPSGQVLSWRFHVEGTIIHHFGSAGASVEELRRLAAQPIDVLLLPLQGHSRICDIALRHVEILRPRCVVPHHWDDFLPPVSQTVDLRPFLAEMRRRFPAVQVIVPQIDQPIYL